MRERFKIIRKENGLTQAEFAERINLSRNFVAQVETGTKVPSARTIADICREFRVNKEWLESGIEPMRWAEPDRDEEARVIAELSENLSDPVLSFVREAMAEYIALDVSERESVKKYATNLLRRLREDSGD